MKVGDYVRTNYGNIFKIKKIDDELFLETFYYVSNDTFVTKDLILKSSPNIIDLIEEDDILKYIYNQKEYVSKVINRGSLMLKVSCDLEVSLGVVEIKSILTKEQFESMEYRIGE